jgi:hypothetical protein
MSDTEIELVKHLDEVNRVVEEYLMIQQRLLKLLLCQEPGL